MATTVEALAKTLEGCIVGETKRVIEDAQAIDHAGQHEVSYISDRKNLHRLKRSNVGVLIVGENLLQEIADNSWPPSVIVVGDAQAAFIEALTGLRSQRPRPIIGVSPDADVSPSATIGEGTNIYPGAFVGEDVVVGENCDIFPGVCVGSGCTLGDFVTLYPQVVLYPDVQVGDRVAVHASAVLGADGFGYRMVDGKYEKIPHFGTVRIEDDVEIGAGTTVDRAMVGETVIGSGTKLDNLVMIAHNCEVGRHNAFASQVGMAGSAKTGDNVQCGGQAGLANQVHVGDDCRVGSRAAIHGDVPAGQTYFGAPGQPAADAMKATMALRKLPELRLRVRQLEKLIVELTAKVDSLSPPGASSASAA